MQTKNIFITIVLLFSMMTTYATDSIALQKSYYVVAKNELVSMLQNKQAPSFERAIYLIENAYYDNKIAFSDFEKIITSQLQNIQRIASTAKMPERKVNYLYELAQQTPKQYAASFKNLSNNWAIYDYMTDTTIYAVTDSIFLFHLPYRYSTSDPMGTIDWRNTQVLNLLFNKKGNCFALASLYKIFADRLQTDATLCTVPNHIYITHKDENGTAYNVDLGSRSFPGLGTLTTFSYATRDAIINGIAPRTLNTQQAISLCMVYLAKGYEHKFGTKDLSADSHDNFMLQCAETAIKYDSLNLNALLLKAELLENNLLQKNKTIAQLQTNNDFKQYEQLIARLYKLGYREMPTDMKNILVNGWTKDTTQLYLNNNLVQSKSETRKASLSWGLFDERHQYKPLEQYAQTLFDCKTKTIKGFAKEKPLYNNYNFDPVAFAWNIDPLAYKYPNESPYIFVSNSPLMFMDPDGREKVVVIGGGDVTGADNYKFVNTGMNQAITFFNQVLKAKTNENITILVTDIFVDQNIRDHLQNFVSALNIKSGLSINILSISYLSSGDEITNYMNSKSQLDEEFSEARMNDPISATSMFGHGYVPEYSSQGTEMGSFEPAHGTSGEEMSLPESYRPMHNIWSWGKQDIDKLNPNAFLKNGSFDYYSCNSATKGTSGQSLASYTTSQLGTISTGFLGTSVYANIYGGKFTINNFVKIINKGITPSANFPTAVGGQQRRNGRATGENSKRIRFTK